MSVRSTLKPLALLSLTSRFNRNPLAVMVAMVAACTAGFAAASEESSSVLPTFRVESQTESSTGPVEGYVAKRSSTASKSKAPLIEIPQSVSVVGRQEMDDRNAQSMPEAVGYTAGVRVESAGIDSRVDDITIRGFDASSWSNNMYLDGLRMPVGGQWTTPQVDAYGMERVEILKGPAAVLYGQVAPGGLVNMIGKRPQADQTNEVLVQVASYDQYKGAFDVGGKLDSDGQWLGRLVASYNDGDSQVDETELSRTYIAPSITWAPNEDVSLTLHGFYQKDDGGSTFQFLTLAGTYFPTQYGYIDRDTFIGEPGWNVFDREEQGIGYELSFAINDFTTFEQNVRYLEVDSLYRGVVTNTAGTPAGLQPDNRTVNRRAVEGRGEMYSLAADNRVAFDFDTGSLHHDLLAGVDYLLTDWQHHRDLVRGTVPPIDVYDPVYSGTADFEETLRPQIYSDAHNEQIGFYVQDLIAIDRWRITLGLRSDEFENKLKNQLTSVVTPIDDDAITGRAGLTYLFDSGIAPYFSYATSFEPLSGTNSSEAPFDPTEGEQIEVGVKYQPDGSDFLITASVFDLRQKNLVVSDSTPPAGAPCITLQNCQTQAGETQTKGFELEGKVSLVEGLSLTGSYTFLDTEVLEGADEGKRLPDVPEHAAALWLDYRFVAGVLNGFSLGGGARYTGSAFGDTPNIYEVDSVTLYDAAIRYDLGAIGCDGLLLSLSANNVTDEEYLSYCNSFGCGYGSGRNVVANARYRW